MIKTLCVWLLFISFLTPSSMAPVAMAAPMAAEITDIATINCNDNGHIEAIDDCKINHCGQCLFMPAQLLVFSQYSTAIVNPYYQYNGFSYIAPLHTPPPIFSFA